MKKTQKYCYLDPNFPKNIYLIYFPIFEDDKPIDLIAVDFTCKTEKEIVEIAKTLGVEFNEENKETPRNMPGLIVYYPLTFQRKFLLKKEQWKEYDEEGFKTYRKLRRNAFFEIVGKTQTYEILVLARERDENNKFIFNIDFPFPKPVSDEALDKFLMSSYSVMAEEVKYGAIYSIGNPLNLNWKTGETGIKPPITREQEMMN